MNPQPLHIFLATDLIAPDTTLMMDLSVSADAA
jgi:hypothetical protein